jgi:hypothetical protein
MNLSDMTDQDKVRKMVRDFFKVCGKEIQEIYSDYYLLNIDPEPRLLTLAERYKKEMPE